MNFNELKSWDSSLNLENSQLPDQVFTSIALFENASQGSLCFIKDKAFYKRWSLKKEELKPLHIGLIIDQALYASLDEEQKNELKNSSGTIITSTQVPISMCLLSKPFYDRLFVDDHDLVDGRQMGTAQIDPRAQIAQNVFIGEGVVIGAGTVIHAGAKILSHVVIGQDSVIYPDVVIYPRCQIGNRVRLHSGTIIGADGFGYEFSAGVHHKIWHLGTVEIHDDVEIGAQSCVDRGTFSATVIGAGSKIDNQVQIGHNCKIGKAVILCGQVGISGSARVGDFTVVGGKAGVGPGVEIGMACQVAGTAMVTGNLADKSVVAGHPARPLKEWMKGVAYLRKESLK